MNSPLFRTFLVLAAASFLPWNASFGQSTPFPDVPPTHLRYDAAMYLRANGIVNGYPDGTFWPDTPINRAEFTKIVMGTPEGGPCTGSSFPDVPADAWFAQVVCIAKQKGIVGGYPDGTFHPTGPVTFAEAAKILAQVYLGAPAPGDPWYRPAVEALGARQDIPTDIASFSSPLTRGQMAELLYRIKANVASKPSRTYMEMATPPAITYEKRQVQTTSGTFDVDIITADLARGVKVITDAATTGNCDGNCPAYPLADYVKRNNGFAGMHGSYFCPPDYKQCATTVNSFIYFVFNAQSRTFVNAEKRSYDNGGGLFVFRPGSAQFFLDPTSFTPDTAIDGAIAMWPALVASGQPLPDHRMMDEKQKTGRGPKGGMGNKGSMLYLLLARNATVPDLRNVMLALGLENGINLDGGGTSAMYIDGTYKVGPGRKLPNAIVLVK